LIGPYDSSNENVLRWHIQLAKAAGISGFFVSVYSWTGHPTMWSNFEAMLRIAYEENFKLGIEGWHPNARIGETEEEWKAEVLRQIDFFTEQSPYRDAFLRIQSRPAYWFDNYWMEYDELLQFLDERNITWIFAGGRTIDELTLLNQQLVHSGVQQFVKYNWPTPSGWEFMPNYLFKLIDVRLREASGLLPFAHGYPGFDETRIAPGPERPQVRFGLWNDGQTLREFLCKSLAGGAEMIFIESFNDWTEYTMLEPGIDIVNEFNIGQETIFDGDPYRYLKIIAEFKQKPWVTPLPPCEIIDPLLSGRGIACQ
jgi:hypothetical protein